MKHQLTEMDHDYDVMLRERIESKKQLEAKFQDINRKIQANKDFTNAEVKRVKDTLKAFTSKFESTVPSPEFTPRHISNAEMRVCTSKLQKEPP